MSTVGKNNLYPMLNALGNTYRTPEEVSCAFLAPPTLQHSDLHVISRPASIGTRAIREAPTECSGVDGE